MSRRHSKPLNPVSERRRRVILQSIVLGLLALVAAYCVYRALTIG